MLHLLRLAGFALALLLLLALFHLIILGIPDPLTRKLTKRLQEEGFPVSIGAITLSPHRGWVLHDLKLYSPLPDDLEPLLSTDKLYVLAWPNPWRGPSQSDWNVRVRSRRIDVSPGRPWGPLAKPLFQTIERASVDLQTEQGAVKITRGNMSWGGVQIHTEGAVACESPKKTATRYDAIRSRIIQTAEVLAGFRFDAPPNLSVRFDIPPNRAALSVHASIDADGFERHTGNCQSLQADISFTNRLLKITRVELVQTPGKQMELTGSLNLKDQTSECSINSSLQLPGLFCLLPPNAPDLLDRLEMQLPGPLEFDARLGPAHLTNLAETVQLELHKAELIRKDLTLSDLSGNVVRTGKRLEISNLQTLANGNLLRGAASIDLASPAWSASLEGSVYPEVIGTLMGGGVKHWIDRFDFTNAPPAMQVNLSHSGQKHSLRMTGTLSGADFTCTGLPVDTINMSMAWSNRVFHLDSLYLTHGEKEFTGSVAVNFETQLATFDAGSSFNPASTARIIAPDHPTVLTNFTFNGPVQATASGQVDYGGGTNHLFSGRIAAEDIVYNGFLADSFDSLVGGKGSDLIFTNTSARIFGGSVTGNGTFDLQPRDNEAPYHIALEVDQINFARVQAAINPGSKSRTTGRLSGSIDFTADGTTDIWESARGGGTVEMVDGHLAELPVLGGFSRLIRTTLPAFSLFSLTTLYSDFQLRDGGLHTDDLQLGGTLLTARAEGSYSPAKGLNFNVVAEPFRRTRTDKEWYHIHLWGAEAIKQGTAPLFKLLEFRLTGRLDKPQWNMQKFPDKIAPDIGKPQGFWHR